MGTCTRLAERAVVMVFTLTMAAAALAAEEDEAAPRDYGDQCRYARHAGAEAESEGPNQGRVRLTVGNDITTAYFFRGILQERNGFIYEPYAELTLNLCRERRHPSTASTPAWACGSACRPRRPAPAASGRANLYETDYYPSLTLGWQGGLDTVAHLPRLHQPERRLQHRAAARPRAGLR